MRRKILLTGASGSVGFEAFQELVKRRVCHDIRILSLDRSQERQLFKPYSGRVEMVWGDIRNPEVGRKAVQGVDVVLHAAGIIPPTADHHPELAHAVNVLGTKNLVDACGLEANPPKFIYTSSVSVYGDRVADPDIRVGDPLRPSDGDQYAQTKIEAEKIIQASRLRWSIFRLCGVLVKQLKIQPLMFHMPLDTALEWCHDSDAGYALIQAIDREAIEGRIFNLGGGEKCQITARDFLKKMFPMWGLDSGILPDYAFATRNFHSGYYRDGDLLNNLLRFRRRTLQDYLDEMRSRVSPLQRWMVGAIPRSILRKWLLKMSDPLKAIQENNEALIGRFYGSRDAFEHLFNKGIVGG